MHGESKEVLHMFTAVWHVTCLSYDDWIHFQCFQFAMAAGPGPVGLGSEHEHTCGGTRKAVNYALP